MELRDIEIFLTLAEELHFGRTADRLHVSQARVSQVIAAQERRLGAALFDRSNRRQVRLTPLGQQLRDDLRPVYTGLHASLQRARLSASGITATLRIGTVAANVQDLRPYWDTFRSRHPQWQLSIRHAPFVEPFVGLRRGDIDALITWLPVDEPDLTVGPILFAEPRVLAVPIGHRLTRHSAVSLETISDFLHSDTAGPDYWKDGFVPSHTRAGRLIERGPMVRSAEEILTLVSVGEIVNLFPSHMTRYWARHDIAYLPLRDMAPLPYAPVWRTETETDLIRAFAQVARDVGKLEL